MAAACGGVVAGCAWEPAGDDAALALTQQAVAATRLGEPLAGITADEFADVRTAFNSVEELPDGLGPIFNEKACGNCHNLGAAGGAGELIERRFGRLVHGVFDTMASQGGSLRALNTVGGFIGANGQSCAIPAEQEPPGTTVHDVGRLTTPLFGVGLIDALPDSVFDAVVASEPPEVRGTVNRVRILLPNPDDPTQSLGGTRVGRFGWKAGIATLVQFSADAYRNEMGITTTHCIAGQSVLTFASEATPNNIALPAGCDDLAPAAPPGDPEGLDDGVGICEADASIIQDDVEEFADFMTFLAPPPPDTTIHRLVARRGAAAFQDAGCADCHFPGAFTTPAAPANGVPGKFTFFPFSDFALHDMGALGDQIGEDGDSLERTRMMRTAPLWGLRFRTKLLHDGRTTDLTTAIRAHAGQAATSVARFNALSTGDRQALLRLLKAI